MQREQIKGLTIGELAKAANVGVETIRYYQKRGLLPNPNKPLQGYKHYAPDLVERLAFIKSAQKLNFSLNEIKELFELSTNQTPDKTQIRQVARQHLAQVQETKQHLDLVEQTLTAWLKRCEASQQNEPCPIIHNLKQADLATAKILPIAQKGEPVLAQIAKPVVDPLNSKIQILIRDMHATMLAANGVGIAAPQVFQSLRIIIVASRPNPRYPDAPLMEPIAMINPEIIWRSEETCSGEEGCLSVANTRGVVPRAERLKVQYCNQEGVILEEEYSGFVARIIQHEVDHLDGVLFVERVAEETANN